MLKKYFLNLFDFAELSIILISQLDCFRYCDFTIYNTDLLSNQYLGSRNDLRKSDYAVTVIRSPVRMCVNTTF